MPLAYAPEEVKERLHAALIHGDLARIIEHTRLNSTMVKEMFNEQCDRNLQFAVVLEILVTLADIDEERGDLAMRVFVDMYESSKRRKPTECLSPDAEAAKLAQDANLVALGRLQGESSYDALVRLQRVERQAGIAKRAVLQEIAGQRQTRLTPEPEMIPAVRSQIREVVGSRRR